MHWNSRGFLLIDSSITDYLTNRERTGLLSLAPGTSCDLYLSWPSRVNFCLWHWRVWTTQFGTVSGTYHHDRPIHTSVTDYTCLWVTQSWKILSAGSISGFHRCKNISDLTLAEFLRQNSRVCDEPRPILRCSTTLCCHRTRPTPHPGEKPPPV